MKISKKIIATILITGFISSCSDDDISSSETTPVVEPTEKVQTKYVVGFQAFPVGNEDSVDYVLELPSIESLSKGEINVKGQGIPLKGWRFFYGSEKNVFTSGYVSENVCYTYGFGVNNVLLPKNNFSFQSSLDNFALVEDKLIAVELNYGGLDVNKTDLPDKRFHIINAHTGVLEKIVEHPIDIDQGDRTPENPGYTPWVTGMVYRNGKLFVSYHKWSGSGNYTTPDTDRAYVAVFKYPEFELEKIIYDERTSPIGVNGHSTGIESTENGDIYSYSSSSLRSGFTSVTKPSGILRINKGEIEFDKDYFFNVETATNGGKLFWMDYIGNGKALGRIVVNKAPITGWDVFTEQGSNFKLVVIDLNAKTVTDVQGIPVHANRYTSPLFVEDGIAYLSARVGEKEATDAETHVYVVNVETAKATKGAKVEGLALKGIFRIKK